MTLDDACRLMLRAMCDAMMRVQVKGTHDSFLDGSLLCPACLKLHGRAADAMEPLLEEARLSGDMRYRDAAEALFGWIEQTMSQPDGSWKNDVDSDWKGITVFTSIMLEHVLSYYGDLLHEDVRNTIGLRLRKSADYLYAVAGALTRNNINYPLSNALALWRLGKYYQEEQYLRKSEELEALAFQVVTNHGLLYGEGVPRERRSPKGCYPIDPGYDFEETIPSLVELAVCKQDARLLELSTRLMREQLRFLLPDGGIDNSWGTRNFKWTWWGSRTSDGPGEALLLLSKQDKRFLGPLVQNIRAMQTCMQQGLLAGGPDYQRAGEKACVHHTFTHAKVLAAIIRDGGGKAIDFDAPLPNGYGRYEEEGISFYDECDTYVAVKGRMSATITGYDWSYIPGGHASGGTISLLYHSLYGPILVAGMCSYFLKEKNNMQVPREKPNHVCATPRLRMGDFSSMYDSRAVLQEKGGVITVQGRLTNQEGRQADKGTYAFTYRMEPDALEIQTEVQDATLVLPIACHSIVSHEAHRIVLSRGENEVVVTSENELHLPFEEELCFNLSPGLLLAPVEICVHGTGTVQICVPKEPK